MVLFVTTGWEIFINKHKKNEPRENKACVTRLKMTADIWRRSKDSIPKKYPGIYRGQSRNFLPVKIRFLHFFDFGMLQEHNITICF
jgi:hypothetical protein